MTQRVWPHVIGAHGVVVSCTLRVFKYFMRKAVGVVLGSIPGERRFLHLPAARLASMHAERKYEGIKLPRRRKREGMSGTKALWSAVNLGF